VTQYLGRDKLYGSKRDAPKWGIRKNSFGGLKNFTKILYTSVLFQNCPL
jgi:hypothetical protein